MYYSLIFQKGVQIMNTGVSDAIKLTMYLEPGAVAVKGEKKRRGLF